MPFSSTITLQVQQQHTNRGIKRLALMTGRMPPSDYELLWLLYERIATLSAAWRREYEFDKIVAILAHYASSSGPKSGMFGSNLGSSFNPTFPYAHLNKEVRAVTVSASSLHTAGLSIE